MSTAGDERSGRGVAVTGASGFIGKMLVAALERSGRRVWRLVRRPPTNPEQEIFWDPAEQLLSPAALEGMDAVVHLAGENVASGRWTDAKKQRIVRSRVEGTELLSHVLASLARPPRVVVTASGIGFYGDQGDRVVDENSPIGEGFLADLCRQWEAATEPLAEVRGLRLANIRLGVVLSPDGGALGKMLTPFKLGLGGVIGTGRQYMSWIASDDLVAAIEFMLKDKMMRGPINLTSPRPVTNREFTKTLGRVLGRPTVVPLPAFAARLAFGEMADEMLLSSTRGEPKKLLTAGFKFRYPELEPALRHLLGR